MFDFQKEVVINDVKNVMTNKDGFVIDGMTYKVNNVVEKTVYETEPVPGKKATITIPLEKVADGKKQVRIELGLDRDYRGSFGSALYYFRKPILMDFREGVKDINELKKACELVAASNDNVLHIVPEDAEVAEDAPKSNSTQIVLEAADDYITIRKAVVVTFDCEPEYCGDEMEAVVAEVELDSTPNVVSFGTYEYLIHNLRLPTYANIRFASPAAVEMPVLGGEYYQYSFEYAVPRRIGGLSVVGQMNYSSTGHTFFVLKSQKAAFEAVLAGLSIVTVKKDEFIGAPEAFVPANAATDAEVEGKLAAAIAEVDAKIAAKHPANE